MKYVEVAEDGTKVVPMRHHRAGQTHCIHGHALVGTNLYLYRDGVGRQHRGCRTCRIEAARRRRSAIAQQRRKQ